MKKIVLSSASPRRKELLSQLGINFIVDPVNGDEETDTDLEPHQLTRVVAIKKALAVAGRHPNTIIIAADTIGVLDGKILGKPHTSVAARKMLTEMSGKAHRVITGYAVLDTATANSISNSVETIVYIKLLSSAEIDRYVKTGEPLDKAGAYGIQDRGAIIVERIEGDYFNVVGLPLFALAKTLKEFGINIL